MYCKDDDLHSCELVSPNYSLNGTDEQLYIGHNIACITFISVYHRSGLFLWHFNFMVFMF